MVSCSGTSGPVLRLSPLDVQPHPDYTRGDPEALVQLDGPRAWRLQVSSARSVRCGGRRMIGRTQGRRREGTRGETARRLIVIH